MGNPSHTVGRVWRQAVVLLALACSPAEPPATPAPQNLDVYTPPSVPAWPDEPAGEDVAEDDASDDAQEDAPPRRYHDAGGVWEGDGEQNDGQTWRMVLRVQGHKEAPCALVSYPPGPGSNIDCEGEWWCDEGLTSGSPLVGVERITGGRHRCIDGCRFHADLSAAEVSFDCQHEGVTVLVRMHRMD